MRKRPAAARLLSQRFKKLATVFALAAAVVLLEVILVSERNGYTINFIKGA